MNQKNSYNFDYFNDTDKKAELTRLHKQAMMIAGLEMAYLKSMNIPQNGCILDIGCGPGFVAGEIAKLCPQAQVTGMDMSDHLLEVANGVVAPEHSNLNFKKGSAYDSGLEDKSFDFIYNRVIYQHLDNPLKAIKEAKRLLKDGGRILIADIDDAVQLFYPDLPSFQKLQDQAGLAQKASGGNRQIGRQLIPLLQQAGFKDLKISIENFSTLQVDFNVFFEIAIAFKAQIIGGDEGQKLVTDIKNEIDQLDQTPFGLAGIIMASGVA